MFFLPSIFSIPRLTVSILMSVLMLGAFVWGGFVLYVTQSTPKAPDVVTDTVVVLTGGAGRSEAGFQIIAEGKAKSMLITGVLGQRSSSNSSPVTMICLPKKFFSETLVVELCR